MRIHDETEVEVTWIHHLKKNGKNSTRTRPLRVSAVQGLCGLALLNVDPEWTNEEMTELWWQRKETRVLNPAFRLVFNHLVAPRRRASSSVSLSLTSHQVNINEVRLDITCLLWLAVQTLHKNIENEVATLSKMLTHWLVYVLHLGLPAPGISPRLADHRLRSARKKRQFIEFESFALFVIYSDKCKIISSLFRFRLSLRPDTLQDAFCHDVFELLISITCWSVFLKKTRTDTWYLDIRIQSWWWEQEQKTHKILLKKVFTHSGVFFFMSRYRPISQNSNRNTYFLYISRSCDQFTVTMTQI